MSTRPRSWKPAGAGLELLNVRDSQRRDASALRKGSSLGSGAKGNRSSPAPLADPSNQEVCMAANVSWHLNRT